MNVSSRSRLEAVMEVERSGGCILLRKKVVPRMESFVLLQDGGFFYFFRKVYDFIR